MWYMSNLLLDVLEDMGASSRIHWKVEVFSPGRLQFVKFHVDKCIILYEAREREMHLNDARYSLRQRSGTASSQTQEAPEPMLPCGIWQAMYSLSDDTPIQAGSFVELRL